MIIKSFDHSKETYELICKAMSGDRDAIRILKNQYNITSDGKHFYYLPKYFLKILNDKERVKFIKDINHELNKLIPKVNDDLTRIENTVRQLIMAIGTTETAKLLEIDHTNISAWLKGNRKWTYNKILDVANKLNSVSMSVLLKSIME